MHWKAFRVMLVLWLSILAFGQVLAQDPGQPDTVRVASVQVNPSPTTPVKFSVRVTLFNDEELYAGQLGFYYNSDAITIDSVSNLGTCRSHLFTITDAAVPAQHLAIVGFVKYVEPHGVMPGDSLLATLWFTLAAGAPDQYIDIDSGFFPPAGDFILTTKFGVSVFPQFKAGKIKVGNPILPPTIGLEPDSFVFNGTVGSPNPPAQVLNITNTGQGTLSWSASWKSTWLSVLPISGIAPSNPAVRANIASLAPGTYYDTITVSGVGATNTPQLVPVTLHLITPAPKIQLVPNNFTFTAVQGTSNPPNQSMLINDIGGGTLAWTATKSSTWLTLSQYSGGPNTTVNLMVDITGLPYATYYDTIVVSDPAASNSPQHAEVILELISSLPVLKVEPLEFKVAASNVVNPYDRILKVINTGGGSLQFSLTSRHSWIKFNPQSGSTTSSRDVIVSFESVGLELGYNYDTIVVTSSNGQESPKRVPVLLWVMENPPGLNVTPNQLVFTGYECSNVPPIPSQPLSITNIAMENMNWSTSWHSSWLRVMPASGENAGTADISVVEVGLPVGTYYDTIRVDAVWSVIPTPQYVEIIFHVIEQTLPPVLAVSKDSLEFIFLAGYVGVAINPSLEIKNGISGCIDWQISNPYSWLTFAPESGSGGPTKVMTYVNGGGLPLGITRGKFSIHSPGSVNDSVVVNFVVYIAQLGDANCDGIVNVADAVYIINYVFIPGSPPPIPRLWAGDANCDYWCNVSDADAIIMYVFHLGGELCWYNPLIP